MKGKGCCKSFILQHPPFHLRRAVLNKAATDKWSGRRIYFWIDSIRICVSATITGAISPVIDTIGRQATGFVHLQDEKYSYLSVKSYANFDLKENEIFTIKSDIYGLKNKPY